ncbi:hypothetical protein DFR30_0205 [Thiogranum longum]|uniref:Lipoprotein n=1 Tax=Thiogranum longum TaxID=1537524 RepID=A0A4R1HA07_9GAMM|nr:hypothetical protein [Thiogranum longum]TCK16985.1 hypothetical protein DFR30_0205 [Thiogranum longum]
MLRIVIAITSILVSGCLPQSGGPSPKAVLVVSSERYQPDQVLKSLDSIGDSLDKKIDKKEEVIEIGETKYRKYDYYEIAYWYPNNGSKYYGVSLVKWMRGDEETDNRYFIDVYSEGEKCELCNTVKSALDQFKIEYYSACEKSNTRTEYEKIRCGT